jgi:hypothetical protein
VIFVVVNFGGAHCFLCIHDSFVVGCGADSGGDGGGGDGGCGGGGCG